MTVFPKTAAVGCVVDFERPPGHAQAFAIEVVRSLIKAIGLAEPEVQMAVFRERSKQGRWRKLSWKALEEAAAAPETQTVDLAIGAPMQVRFLASLQVRDDERFREVAPPRRCHFVCDTSSWDASSAVQAGRELLSDRSATPG